MLGVPETLQIATPAPAAMTTSPPITTTSRHQRVRCTLLSDGLSDRLAGLRRRARRHLVPTCDRDIRAGPQAYTPNDDRIGTARLGPELITIPTIHLCRRAG